MAEKKDKYSTVKLKWKNAGTIPVRKRKSDGKYVKADVAAGNKKEKEAAKKAGVDNYQIKGINPNGKGTFAVMSNSKNSERVTQARQSANGCK
jgi:hypothetical protein